MQSYLLVHPGLSTAWTFLLHVLFFMKLLPLQLPLPCPSHKLCLFVQKYKTQTSLPYKSPQSLFPSWGSQAAEKGGAA